MPMDRELDLHVQCTPVSREGRFCEEAHPPPQDTLSKLAAKLRDLETQDGVDDSAIYDLVTSQQALPSRTRLKVWH